MFGVKGDFEMVQAFHVESNISEIIPPDPSQPGRRSVSYDKLFLNCLNSGQPKLSVLSR
jgi:hypothetical protein